MKYWRNIVFEFIEEHACYRNNLPIVNHFIRKMDFLESFQDGLHIRQSVEFVDILFANFQSVRKDYLSFSEILENHWQP